MIGNASGQSWGTAYPFVAADDARPTQALVIGTEIVDGSHQISALVQGRTLACAEGGIQAFDVGRVDITSTLGTLDQLVDLRQDTLNKTAFDAAHAVASILLDDLNIDGDLQPDLIGVVNIETSRSKGKVDDLLTRCSFRGACH